MWVHQFNFIFWRYRAFKSRSFLQELHSLPACPLSFAQPNRYGSMIALANTVNFLNCMYCNTPDSEDWSVCLSWRKRQDEPSSGQMCHIIQLSLFKASHAKPLSFFFFITDFLKCISPPTHAYTQAESCREKKGSCCAKGLKQSHVSKIQIHVR